MKPPLSSKTVIMYIYKYDDFCIGRIMGKDKKKLQKDWN
jgi:hypothetical protein